MARTNFIEATAATALVLFALIMKAQPERKQVSRFTETYSQKTTLNYILVLPRQYADKGTKWPLIVYLHGAGERGDDISRVEQTTIVQRAEGSQDFPFLLLAPQEPDPDQSWNYPNNSAAVIHLLDFIMTHYNADSTRVYLTGNSMGGWGTWFLAKEYPYRFAAIAPVCGLDPDVSWAAKIVNTPVWAFHGTDDHVADPLQTERMIEALQNLGGDPRFTPLVGRDHAIASTVYTRGDLYIWFLQHHR